MDVGMGVATSKSCLPFLLSLPFPACLAVRRGLRPETCPRTWEEVSYTVAELAPRKPPCKSSTPSLLTCRGSGGLLQGPSDGGAPGTVWLPRDRVAQHPASRLWPWVL